jgi:hypothetical protein
MSECVLSEDMMRLNAKYSIIAIHGLDGHRIKSWTMDSGAFWLQDQLPSVAPRARVMTYGYNAYTRGSSVLSNQKIYQHGQDLITLLANERQKPEVNPAPSHKATLLFSYSFLGCKATNHFHCAQPWRACPEICRCCSVLIDHANESFQALLAGALCGRSHHHKHVELSTAAIFYLGTPHQGSEGANFMSIALQLYSLTAPSNTNVVKDLRPLSDFLQLQQLQYSRISSRYITYFCYETSPTVVPGGSKVIVPRSSAVAMSGPDTYEIGVPADHIGISKSSEAFESLREALSHTISAATAKCKDRWIRYESKTGRSTVLIYSHYFMR